MICKITNLINYFLFINYIKITSDQFESPESKKKKIVDDFIA